jgi:hypothetical protein
MKMSFFRWISGWFCAPWLMAALSTNPNLGEGGIFGEVVGEHDEIGVPVDLKLALLPFLKLRISGALV